MLHTQKFLIAAKEAGKDPFVELTNELGIKCRHYPEGLTLLDYDQIDSPSGHPIVLECRSMIINTHTFDVIARKFDRFHNAGEQPELTKDFDVSRSTVFLKEDGSIIGIYRNPYTSKWEISTRGMAKAEGEHYTGKSFREMVINALGVKDEEDFQQTMEFVCKDWGQIYFTFEWVSPENKIVTPYEKSELVLLGVGIDGFDCTSEINGLEYWVEQFECVPCSMNVRMPRMFETVSDLNEALQKANELTGMLEGFVLYDPVINKRIKVKSSTYVSAHRLRGNDPIPSRKNMLELVLTGEVDEFLTYFSEWEELVRSLQAEVETFLSETEIVYNNAKGIESQKDFALAVKDSKGAVYMFTARKLNQDIRPIFNSASLTQKMKTFGV